MILVLSRRCSDKSHIIQYPHGIVGFVPSFCEFESTIVHQPTWPEKAMSNLQCPSSIILRDSVIIPHMYIYVYIDTYYVYMFLCIYIYIYQYIHVNMCRLHIHIHIYIFIYIPVCILSISTMMGPPSPFRQERFLKDPQQLRKATVRIDEILSFEYLYLGWIEEHHENAVLYWKCWKSAGINGNISMFFTGIDLTWFNAVLYWKCWV